MDTIKLTGRKNEPHITVASEGYEENLNFELAGAELTTRANGYDLDRFQIQLRHENGTDVEHDSAAVALLEGVGLKFQRMQYGTVHFKGLLLSGYWYDSDAALELGKEFSHSPNHGAVRVCNDTEYFHRPGSDSSADHLLLPFMPPERSFAPLEVKITVSYRHFMENAGE